MLIIEIKVMVQKRIAEYIDTANAIRFVIKNRLKELKANS